MPEIDILIKKSSTGQGQAPVTPQAEREPGKPNIQQQAVNAALINAGKNILYQGVNQYAELTGNYAIAETMNDVLSITSDIAILSTGPIGWIAVGSKTVINIGGSFVKQDRAWKETELLRERAGYISLQGSRY